MNTDLLITEYFQSYLAFGTSEVSLYPHALGFLLLLDDRMSTESVIIQKTAQLFGRGKSELWFSEFDWLKYEIPMY